MFALIKQNIEIIYNYNKVKINKDKLFKTIVQKNNVITISQARNKVKALIKKEQNKQLQTIKQQDKQSVNTRIK